MDKFKIAHFERDNPGRLFPEFRSLSPTEVQAIQRKLLGRFGIDSSESVASFLNLIASNEQFVAGVNAEHSDFCLRSVLLAEGIQPESKLFVNWDRYNSIDEFQTADLSTYFDYVWYPGSDDIDIFDNTMSWILSVRHDGAVSLTKNDPVPRQHSR